MTSTKYFTRDLSFAAALLATGHEVSHLEPLGDIRGRFVFVLELTIADGRKLESDYYNYRFDVDARSMIEKIRQLKQRSEEESNNGQ